VRGECEEQAVTLDVTVAIPTIPPRTGNGGLLKHAVYSVRQQTRLPAGGISCALDVDKAGAAVTRQRALDAVRTKWVAFLDDDDFFYPHHLETLHTLVSDHGADYGFSWFDGNNPFPGHRGRQMNPDEPHHTTMTVFVRTELAKAVGFATDHPEGWTLPQEDWRFTLGCIEAGAKFVGTDEVTWHYRAHGKNTSGLPTRW
jgi:glycosyltransferase involved in cell wall biosynthesis